MRLLEYQVDKFYRDCIYQNSEKHKCAKKGFRLAKWMSKDREFWLTSNDCTDADFVKEVWKENDLIPESELIEILARFLCGYDLYELLNTDASEEVIDINITDEVLENKIKFIKQCIKDI